MNDEGDTNKNIYQMNDNGKEEVCLVCNTKQDVNKNLDIDSTRKGK